MRSPSAKHQQLCSCRQIEWTGEVIQLAWKPRIFLYKKFLSDAECDHLVNKGRSGITPSEVLTPAHLLRARTY